MAKKKAENVGLMLGDERFFEEDGNIIVEDNNPEEGTVEDLNSKSAYGDFVGAGFNANEG